MPLYIDDTTVIQEVLTDEDGDPVNSATVTVTIFDCETGEEIIDESWPVALDYVAASDGIYRKTFDPFTSLVDGQQYKVVTLAVDGAVQTPCTKQIKAAIKYC